MAAASNPAASNPATSNPATSNLTTFPLQHRHQRGEWSLFGQENIIHTKDNRRAQIIVDVINSSDVTKRFPLELGQVIMSYHQVSNFLEGPPSAPLSVRYQGLSRPQVEHDASTLIYRSFGETREGKQETLSLLQINQKWFVTAESLDDSNSTPESFRLATSLNQELANASGSISIGRDSGTFYFSFTRNDGTRCCQLAQVNESGTELMPVGVPQMLPSDVKDKKWSLGFKPSQNRYDHALGGFLASSGASDLVFISSVPTDVASPPAAPAAAAAAGAGAGAGASASVARDVDGVAWSMTHFCTSLPDLICEGESHPIPDGLQFDCSHIRGIAPHRFIAVTSDGALLECSYEIKKQKLRVELKSPAIHSMSDNVMAINASYFCCIASSSSMDQPSADVFYAVPRVQNQLYTFSLTGVALFQRPLTFTGHYPVVGASLNREGILAYWDDHDRVHLVDVMNNQSLASLQAPNPKASKGSRPMLVLGNSGMLVSNVWHHSSVADWSVNDYLLVAEDTPQPAPATAVGNRADATPRATNGSVAPTAASTPYISPWEIILVFGD